MLKSQSSLLHRYIDFFQIAFEGTYPGTRPDYRNLIGSVSRLTLNALLHCDAAYHNVEHTLLVTQAGQEILRGKQILDGDVTSEDWVHAIVALLCHDIGYVKGICQQDRVDVSQYDTGAAAQYIVLAPQQTAASLAPYHVDRGKQFVAEAFQRHPLLNVAMVQRHIEHTRFPVPKDRLHQDTLHYPGLIRAGDLIGQLSDPNYLDKLPALYREFEEIGTNQALSYHSSADLRADYPRFFHEVVYPYIQDALEYLKVTRLGKQILKNLYANLAIVESEQRSLAA